MERTVFKRTFRIDDKDELSAAMGGHSSVDDMEAKSRLSAVETAIRAQVKVSRDSGGNCRFAHTTLP